MDPVPENFALLESYCRGERNLGVDHFCDELVQKFDYSQHVRLHQEHGKVHEHLESGGVDRSTVNKVVKDYQLHVVVREEMVV